MILALAVKNIIRNKKNSAVITALLTVITLLFFIGNSIIARSSRGLRRSYIESLTGDLIIEKQGEVTMNLFGANAPIVEDYFSIPVLPAYSLLINAVREMPEIAAAAGQVSTKAAMEYAGGGRQPALLCGVDGGDYFPLFPGIKLEEGRFLRTGESGVMLTRAAAADLSRRAGVPPPVPGAMITFTAAGNFGFKIREVPLAGIFSYDSPSGFMNNIAIIDAQTARILAQIQIATADVEVDDSAVSLISLSDDDLFGESAAGDGSLRSEENAGVKTAVDTPPPPPIDAGDWNFIIVRLQPGVNAALFTNSLNKTLERYGAAALGWRLAAGGSAIIVLLLSALFNGGMALVSIAGIIAVINILLIAVFKRTREIGTLRVVGASRGYIRALILGENALLGLAAGLVSCALGALALRVINGMHIHIGNEILAAMLGGAELRVDFSLTLASVSAAAALLLSVLSSVYPVETAVKIEPVVALRQG
ncbi:MAG: FtsX-like permease family protein [Spirochaetaceae bacterium]|jgi:ABC-type lipoprotein release transport system permease subunit|nr:FtsX-like permease family protein [Spirochaetaceae bacterium]